MEKMIKTARNFDIMAKTVYWFFLVAAALLAVGAAAVWLLDDSMFLGQTYTYQFGNLVFVETPDGMAAPDMLRTNLSASLLLCAVLLAFACACIRIVRKILVPMKEGRPFQEDAVRSFRSLAWITLIAGAIYEGGTAILELVRYRQQLFLQSLSSAGFEYVRFEYQPDFLFVLLFVVLMLMSYVFQYGQQLQKLDDETL